MMDQKNMKTKWSVSFISLTCGANSNILAKLLIGRRYMKKHLMLSTMKVVAIDGRVRKHSLLIMLIILLYFTCSRLE